MHIRFRPRHKAALSIVVGEAYEYPWLPLHYQMLVNENLKLRPGPPSAEPAASVGGDAAIPTRRSVGVRIGVARNLL
jgi:hypothetical protein